MLSLRPSNWSCGDDHSNILRQDYNLHPRISDLDAHRPGSLWVSATSQGSNKYAREQSSRHLSQFEVALLNVLRVRHLHRAWKSARVWRLVLKPNRSVSRVSFWIVVGRDALN